MIRLAQSLSTIWLISLLTSCQPTLPPPTPMNLADQPIIPKPLKVQATGSSFRLGSNTKITVLAPDSLVAATRQVAEQLQLLLRPSTGFDLPIGTKKQGTHLPEIILAILPLENLASEGYQIDIQESKIAINANTATGLYRAIQTIRQLLPARLELNRQQEGPWEIASGQIEDTPTYAYRGVMLDVSRHFFSVATVKRFIDQITLYKINGLHLHLSDDQGWRIEIKSWPNLTTIGGSTQVGGGKGGFYTQEDYQEIIQYATDRHILVIPEIDMPGHTNAALAAYPVLNCDGKATELYTGMKVGFSTLCVRKDTTYQFVDDVIRELAAITPGPYIHIGGDESHVTSQEDYNFFIGKTQKIVAKYGKIMMGWDEIANGNLEGPFIAQHWNNRSHGKTAVTKKGQLIMSPATRAYIDMQYDSTSRIGLHWAAYIEIDSAYLWEPTAWIPGVGKEHIKGIEAPLWTETVTNSDDIEYLTFPRLPGHGEIGWTPVADRNWEDYRIRLGKHKSRFEAMGIDYYPSAQIPWEDTEVLPVFDGVKD